MLKGLNNNTSAFSMENLLSREKLSPSNLDNSDETDRSSLENFKLSHDHLKFGQHEKKPSLSPSDNARIDPDNDRLSPVLTGDKNDLFLRFNNCFNKNAICSSCGRFDCNFFQCRMGESVVSTVKDSKPVLKFSVSAILGTENQPKHIQNGKLKTGLIGEVK